MSFEGSFRRVALFGGAYNNYLALQATLDDAARRGAEAVYFLGDCGGFGPHPDRTVSLLAEHEVPSVQGNYDDSVGNGREDCACGYTDPRDNYFAQVSYDYTLANTHATSRHWLRSMPTHRRLRIGGQRVLLVHGSPRRVNEFLWESTTPRAFVDHLCRAHHTDLIACTHTGMHWERRLEDGRGVLNVGAIGRPANDGCTEVWYTLVEAGDSGVQTTFVPVAYDHVRLSREMTAEGLPAEFVETIRTGWWTTCLEILPGKERARSRH